MTCYAHSKEGLPREQWQTLTDHLENVARLAEERARVFGAGDWGRAAGLLHDLGKCTRAFQRRLRGGPAVDHSSAGAQKAMELFGKHKGKLLAYTLAGHHGGMPDGINGKGTDLLKRLSKKTPPLLDSPPLELAGMALPDPTLTLGENPGFTFSFFGRMVFSCLVDADFLDTEAFMNSQRAGQRQSWPSLPQLWSRLEAFLEQLTAKADQAPLNRRRNHILQACLEAARRDRGMFSLTAPTGGGKTISSLAFALKHALVQGQRRVIYAIPYTSIIEQTAAVFRDILGREAVLEHHSNLPLPEKDDEQGYESYRRIRLAAENWDASLVVTTNVQFFESLFSNRPSRCRKLHNIAGSVIILDEAQMLPREALLPCLEALRELVQNYGCSVLLCTATQPALNNAETFRSARIEPTEIAPEPARLYEEFRRVEVIPHEEPLESRELAVALAQSEQVLCIVNTRRQAREVFEQLRERVGARGLFHLSTLMYPGHRSQKLARIKKALQEGRPCRVVSTQLVEAGVDLDFPVVWRALAGVDSLAQAAGRCNREGKLAGRGRLHVFELSEERLPHSLVAPAEEGRMIMRNFEDPLSLEAVGAFFDNLFWRQRDQLDKNKVLDLLGSGISDIQFNYAEAAEAFRCFDSPGEAILVCPDDGLRQEIIAGLQDSSHPGVFARRAQPYTVQLWPNELSELQARGDLERVGKGMFPVLNNLDIYHDELGLMIDQAGRRSPAGLVI